MPLDNQTKQQRWAKLVRLAENMCHGTVEIKIQDGTPVLVEVAVKKIKLDAEDDQMQDLFKTIGL